MDFDYKKLPWGDSKTWEKGYVYPLPTSCDVVFKGKEVVVDSYLWDLFKLEEGGLDGDIEPINIHGSFDHCVRVANEINPEKLWSRPWIKNKWEEFK